MQLTRSGLLPGLFRNSIFSGLTNTIQRLNRGRLLGHCGISLSTSVLLSVILICSILACLDGWRTWQARDVILTEDKEETANLARSLAQHAHDIVQAADTILIGLRERVQHDRLSAESLERLHQLMVLRVTALPTIHGLFFYDADGNWLATSLNETPAGFNNNDRDYFQYHQSHPDSGAHVGRPVRSKSDNSWIITVSRRVNDDRGHFAGVVLATISSTALSSFYGTFDVGSQGVISLLTADGLLVARDRQNEAKIGTSLANGPIFRDFLPHASVGSFRYASSVGGVDRLGSYRVVADYPLVMVVSHGYDDVVAAWHATAIRQVGLSIILLLTFTLIGLRFAGQIRAQQETELQYRLLADNSSDAITCNEMSGQPQYISPAFTTLTGWSVTEGLARHWRSNVHSDDWAIVEDVQARLRAGEQKLSACYRYVCKSGAHLWVEAAFKLAPTHKTGERQFIINIRDISDRKLAEDGLADAMQQLAFQASTDGLTGLANRRHFDTVLRKEWDRAARNEEPLSLLLIDIDRFKLFNDLYGHLQGDDCLRIVSTAIAVTAQRPSDLVARFGGEEIAMLLPNTDDLGAAHVAEAVRSAIQATNLVHESNPPSCVVTGSIGAATAYPTPHDQPYDTNLLVANADVALYEAKHAGRDRVVVADRVLGRVVN